jgi:hypothetical protein
MVYESAGAAKGSTKILQRLYRLKWQSAELGARHVSAGIGARTADEIRGCPLSEADIAC